MTAASVTGLLASMIGPLGTTQQRNGLPAGSDSMRCCYIFKDVVIRRTVVSRMRSLGSLFAVVVVVTFFNHNFVNCKATLILAIKIYEIKYNISLNDEHT